MHWEDCSVSRQLEILHLWNNSRWNACTISTYGNNNCNILSSTTLLLMLNVLPFRSNNLSFDPIPPWSSLIGSIDQLIWYFTVIFCLFSVCQIAVHSTHHWLQGWQHEHEQLSRACDQYWCSLSECHSTSEESITTQLLHWEKLTDGLAAYLAWQILSTCSFSCLWLTGKLTVQYWLHIQQQCFLQH